LVAAGISVLSKQVLRRHKHARRTKAALEGVAVTEGSLQVYDFATIGQPLDSLDGGTICLHRKHQACANNFTVYTDCTSTAYAVLAADVSTSQVQLLSQEIRKVNARQDLSINPLAIHLK